MTDKWGAKDRAVDTSTNFGNDDEIDTSKTTVFGRAGDLGLSALKGAIAVPEMAVGLANLVSGGKAGKAVESAGIRFKDAKDILDAQKSDAAKEADRKFRLAEGFTGKLGAAVESPSLIANTLVESAAPMLAGGVVGRGLSIAAPRLAGYAGAIGEGVVGAGSAAEQIRQESADGELSGKQAALAGASGLATGLLGYGGGKLANRFGVGDIDTALAGGARTATAQAGKEAPGMLKRVGGGALSEGVFEELPQSVSEQMLQNVALDRDPMQGVDAATAMGLLSGGVMGGGMGVVSGQPKQQPAATQAQPPVQIGPVVPGAPVAPATPAQRMGIDPAAGALSAAAAVAVNNAEIGSASLTEPSFDERKSTLFQQASDQETRDKIRARFGDQGLNEFLYYLNAANRTDVPQRTLDNMLTVAERMLSDSVLTQDQGNQRRAIGNNAPSQGALGGIDTATGQPAIGVDMTPSGRFTVGPDGTATAETRVQRGDSQRRADEIDGLGMTPIRGKAPQPPLAIGMDTTQSGRMVAAADGTLVPETRVQQSEAQRRAQEMQQERDALGKQEGKRSPPEAPLQPIARTLTGTSTIGMLGRASDPLLSGVSDRRVAAENEAQRKAEEDQRRFETARSGTLLSLPAKGSTLRPLSVEDGMNLIYANANGRALIPQEKGFLDLLRKEMGDDAYGRMEQVAAAPFLFKKQDRDALIKPNKAAIEAWDASNASTQQGGKAGLNLVRPSQPPAPGQKNPPVVPPAPAPVAKQEPFKPVPVANKRHAAGLGVVTPPAPQPPQGTPNGTQAAQAQQTAPQRQEAPAGAVSAGGQVEAKPTPTTPPLPSSKASPAPEAGPTNQGAANGQGQETLLNAVPPTGARTVNAAPVAEPPASKAENLAKIKRSNQAMAQPAPAPGTSFAAGDKVELVDGDTLKTGVVVRPPNARGRATVRVDGEESVSRVDASAIQKPGSGRNAVMAGDGKVDQAKPERQYDLVAINERTNKKTKLNATPLTHQQAVTMKSKQTNRDGVRVQLEEIVQPADTASKATGNNGDFSGNNQDIRFSRQDAPASPRTPASTIRASIEKAYGNLLSKLEAKGLVTIAQTEREAIEAAAQARADKTGGDVDAIASRMMSLAGVDVKYSANGNIEGFFDRQTGKSFLVADNLTSASAPGTLMHEVGIHMAADGKMAELFKRAGSILKTGSGNAFIQRVKDRMARAGESSDEEAAAYITTEYESDRLNSPVTVGKWIADLTAAVRAWLFRNGIVLKAEQLTIADIAAVARANARSMARGGPSGGPGGGQSFSRNVGDAAPDEAQRVQDAIEGKSLIEAAMFLTRSSNKANAAIAQKVAEKLKSMEEAGVDLKLHIIHRGDMAPAALANSRGYTESGFDSKGSDVSVWLNGADVAGKVGTEEEVLLHELVHAATTGMVQYGGMKPDTQSGRNVKDLMAVTDAIASHIQQRFIDSEAGKVTLTEFEMDMRDGANNAFRSDDEVLAWALSNAEAQQYLEGIPYKSGSLWSNFVRSVRSLLGMSSDMDTALSEVLRVAERLMTDDPAKTGRSAFWHKRGIRMIQQQGRGSIVQTQTRSAMPATIEVDGKTRSTMNSNGQPIHPTLEGVRNFWKWFGDSDVVDDGDRPIVFYHGGNAEFNQIKPGGRFGGAIFVREGAPSGYGSAQHAVYVRGPVASLEELSDALETPEGQNVLAKELRREADDEVFEKVIEALTDGSVYPSDEDVWDALGAIDEADAQLEIQKLRGKVSRLLRFGAVRTPDEFDGETVMVVDPTQIKSSTENTGDFSAADPDIRYSRGGGIDHANMGTVGENDSQSSNWDAPLASSWDDKIYKLQDKNIDTKRVIQAIKKMAGDIQDKLNVYLQEELYHGRTAKRVLEFGRGELNPALDELAAMGYSIEDLEEYMHARHAPEANVVLAARNPTREMIDAARAEAKADIKRLKAELSVEGVSKEDAKALKAELKKAEAKLKSWTGVAAFNGTEEERNSLSGMKTEEAEAYFRNLPAEDAAKLKTVADKMDAIMAETSNMMVAYHLESQETVDGWNAMYRHYIPLHREGKDDGSMGTGQGFSIKGREVKGRTGSKRKVVNIVAHIAEAREKTIVRGEKNRIAQALVGLVTAYPNADFWKTGAPPSERVFDRATGKVKNQVNPAYKSLPNVVMAKIMDEDGKVKEVAVTFNDGDERAVRMAGALKNLDTPQIEGWLGTVAKATRYFAAVNTQFNPVFGAVNLVRDIQGAMINIGATPLADQKLKIARDSVDALIGIYRDIRATRRGEVGSSKWSELYEQFQHDGGQTGFRNLFETTDDRSQELKDRVSPTDWAKSPLGRIMSANGKLTKQAQWMRDGFAIARDWLSDYNETMESATRLATYKAALDKGMTRDQAASLAKNITVNFNRKGTMGTQAGALYAFFNAAMQGTARMGETLVTMDPGKPKTMRLSPFGKKVVYGGVLLGAIQALALAAGGFGDEEPPDFERERNLLIPTGWTGVGPDKGYIKIPMPLGLHVIPGIGRMGMEFALSGGKDPAKAAIKFGSMMADAFNPIGNAGLSMQTVAPTVLDPLAALVENKDWTGKNIARESFNKDAPMFSQHKDSATFVAKFLAELVNYATGGNEYVGGALNWSPDQIDYLIGQVTGGVGRELSKVEQTATGAFTGDETPIYKVPLLGRFAGSASGKSGEANAFYTNADKLNRLETELKGMQKDGKLAEAAELRMNRPESRMIVGFNMAERQVQKLRKQKSALIEAGADTAEVRAVDERITAIMQNMNQRMLAVSGA